VCCGPANNRWATVILDPKGAGDGAPQKKRGGEGENRWPRLETLKPEGESPMAPMPMPVRGGQRGGVDGDEKDLHA